MAIDTNAKRLADRAADMLSRAIVDATPDDQLEGLIERAERANTALDALADQGAVLEHLPYPIKDVAEFEGSRGYLPADDLEVIADRLIARHPQYFGHIDRTSIMWLWKGKANRRGWTKAANDLLGYLVDDETKFVIWLAANVLREEQFTHRQVEAQVFHELCHIVEDDKGKLGVTAEHDFEGYEAELLVYGPWTGELARAKRSFDAAPPVGLGPLFDHDDEETGI